MILMDWQLLHCSRNLEAFIYGLVAVMTMPLTENSRETRLLSTSLSLRGNSSLRRAICHQQSSSVSGNSPLWCLRYRRTESSMILMVSRGEAMMRS